MTLLEIAKEIAKKYNILDVGICSLEAVGEYLPSRKVELLPKKGTVLVFLAPYYIGEYSDRNVAYYSMTDDYHATFGEILSNIAKELSEKYPKDSFLPMTDASPIPEVKAALLAGLGVLGRHSMLLTKDYGSYVFIGEIVSSVDEVCFLHEISPCIECGLCQEACPTGAITENGLEFTRCISYITQLKGELSKEQTQFLLKGGKVWGCDICTEICPYNITPKLSKLSLANKNLLPKLTVDDIEGDIVKNKSYMWRGKKVLYRNLKIFSDGGDSGVGGDNNQGDV